MITFSTLAEAQLTELAALDAKTNKSPWSLFNYQQSYHDENHQIIVIH